MDLLCNSNARKANPLTNSLPCLLLRQSGHRRLQ